MIIVMETETEIAATATTPIATDIVADETDGMNEMDAIPEMGETVEMDAIGTAPEALGGKMSTERNRR